MVALILLMLGIGTAAFASPVGLPMPVVYTGQRSVAPGQLLEAHISSPDVNGILIITRIGVPDREVMRLPLNGLERRQATDTANSSGLGWPVSISISIPENWPSGVYRLAMAADEPCPACETLVVVRSQAPSQGQPMLYLAPSLTWHAASTFGGWGFRQPDGHPSPLGRMSLNRPTGAEHFERHEGRLLRWLVSQGYAMEFVTERDLANLGEDRYRYSCLVVPPLAQFIPGETFEAIRQWRNGGQNILHLGAHSLSDQVRFTSDSEGLYYYHDPQRDPLHEVDNSSLAVGFRHALVGKSESGILGGRWEVGFRNEHAWSYTVSDEINPAYENTGLRSGEVIPVPMMGVEWDRLGPGFNPLLSMIGVADADEPMADRPVRYPTSLFYRHDPEHGHTTGHGAEVFSAGSVLWWRGLWDGFGHSEAPIEAITRNLVRKLGGHEPSPLRQSPGPRMVFGGCLKPWVDPGEASQWLVLTDETAPQLSGILTEAIWQEPILAEVGTLPAPEGLSLRLLESLPDEQGRHGEVGLHAISIGAMGLPGVSRWPRLSVRAPEEPVAAAFNPHQRKEILRLMARIAAGELEGLPQGEGFRISVGGFLNTDLTTAGGRLELAVAVAHPDGPEAVAAVEARLWGRHLLDLSPDAPGVWAGTRTYREPLPRGRFPVSVVATDVDGRQSMLWPGVAVGSPENYRDPFAKDRLLAIEEAFFDAPGPWWWPWRR